MTRKQAIDEVCHEITHIVLVTLQPIQGVSHAMSDALTLFCFCSFWIELLL